MARDAIHASRNAQWLANGQVVALPVAASAFLALTQAFGLEVLPLGTRFLYWLTLLGFGEALSLAIRSVLDRLQMSGPRLALTGAFAVVLMCLGMTVFVWLVTAFALSQPLLVSRLPGLFLPVLVIGSAMTGINLLAQRRPVVTHARTADEASRPPPLLARLPPRLKGAKLYAVQAEDHYVRVCTAAGSDLVLMRFADALRELAGVEGAQVHRSWWVARDAVETAGRENGKPVLVLRDGRKVPISRGYMRSLKADGWL